MWFNFRHAPPQFGGPETLVLHRVVRRALHKEHRPLDHSIPRMRVVNKKKDLNSTLLLLFFFFTLVTGPTMFLSLKLTQPYRMNWICYRRSLVADFRIDTCSPTCLLTGVPRS